MNGSVTRWRWDADAGGRSGGVSGGDEVLPIEVRQLPEDLARLDRVLSDEVLLFSIAQAWQETARERGRLSISMVTFVRLMVVWQRTGWGYEALGRECRTRCT